MLLSYDGNNIYITTLKGLSTLNYQDFVQSTEQIYRYLTEAIMDVYQEYATRPIKLCQYKIGYSCISQLLQECSFMI